MEPLDLLFLMVINGLLDGATDIPHIVIPYSGKINRMGLSCFASTTATVELYVNRSATGATISVASQTSNYVTGLNVTIDEVMNFF